MRYFYLFLKNNPAINEWLEMIATAVIFGGIGILGGLSSSYKKTSSREFDDALFEVIMKERNKR